MLLATIILLLLKRHLHMAVEAPHHALLHPLMVMDAIDKQTNTDNHLRYSTVIPLSGTIAADTLFPMYASAFANPDPFKADSGLTYSLPLSRKRSRDSSSMCPFSNSPNINQNPIDRSANFTFLGEDISSQIQQQQIEIDQFVARHIEKVRVDIDETQKRNSRKLIAALEEGITQRFRAKEEEIVKMARLNWALEEKLKSLYIENQIWRELAQTNEATANALRSSLKQVLEQVVNGKYRHCSTAVADDDEALAVAVAVADDAQSCCESNNTSSNERMLAEHDSGKSNMIRLCKSCGKAEPCVLLLPCRHLCLCTVCASSVNICPVCKSAKNISVHVHMS